jgi:RTX calcium-binding nonapeptide repeat (4 copies)
VNGFASNNSIWGEPGNDTIFASDGNDTIIGSAGHDVLDGGEGVNLLWANDAGSDTILVQASPVPGSQCTKVVEFFEAGGTNDVVRLLGSSLSRFAGYTAFLNNIGNAVGNNLLVNASSGAQLYLNLGATQTAIWFQGVGAYSLRSADFLFG